MPVLRMCVSKFPSTFARKLHKRVGAAPTTQHVTKYTWQHSSHDEHIPLCVRTHRGCVQLQGSNQESKTLTALAQHAGTKYLSAQWSPLRVVLPAYQENNQHTSRLDVVCVHSCQHAHFPRTRLILHYNGGGVGWNRQPSSSQTYSLGCCLTFTTIPKRPHPRPHPLPPPVRSLSPRP